MRILIVEDESLLRLTLKSNLEATAEPTPGTRHEIFVAASFPEAMRLLDAESIDVAFLDLNLGPGDQEGGVRILRHLRETSPATAVVMMTGVDDVKMIEGCLKLGAADYVLKPYDPRTVNHLMIKAIVRQRLFRRAESLRAQAGDRVVEPIQLRSKSQKFTEVLRQAERLKGKRLRVLITGETGTGKEVMAQYLWSLEGDLNRPFIPVHCGAISPELVESALFGHLKGAFTGAASDRRGYFEDAHGGDIFLDEIGTMPTEVQVKLLRTLGSGEVVRVGATQGKRFDFRVIAATNDDLDEAAAEKRFREDLLFRIKEVELRLPPLRDRKEDIADLVGEFLRDAGHANKRFSRDALEACVSYRWPGNVRQLQKVVAVLAELGDGEEIGLAEVRRQLGLDRAVSEERGSRADGSGRVRAVSEERAQEGKTCSLFTLSPDQVQGRFQAVTEDLERAMVRFALDSTKNDTRAASFLGIPRNSLIRRVTEWGWRI